MEDQLKQHKLEAAKKRVEKLKGFYQHLMSYLLVNTILIIIIGSSIVRSGGSFWNFGTFSVAFFWGIGLFFHALAVFGLPIFFSKDWEERKIKEFMEKDSTDFPSNRIK
ncbi:2TM domain-containing protein [Flavobacteriaceae bacterium M23B6Z8]